MATVENTRDTHVSPKTKTGTKGKSPESETVPGFTIKSRMKHVKVFWGILNVPLYQYSIVLSLWVTLRFIVKLVNS